MDPVSRNLDREILDSADGREAVADLKSQLGALQIGGGRDLLMDNDYDVIDERPEVATITPGISIDEPEPEPGADNCRYSVAEERRLNTARMWSDRVLDEFMKARVLPKIPDLEVDSEAVHTWDIENYRHLSKKERGPKFDCGGHPWCVVWRTLVLPLSFGHFNQAYHSDRQILLFPFGNNADFASFYLEQGHDEENKPEEGWYACAQFTLVLWNKQDPTIYVMHCRSFQGANSVAKADLSLQLPITDSMLRRATGVSRGLQKSESCLLLSGKTEEDQ
jgi:ubiquitin carboxyl-terminal hydrolase 7